MDFACGHRATVDFDALAATLYPQGFAHGWQAVTGVKNHDLVAVGHDPRLPAQADGSRVQGKTSLS
jgi:hypothetical protein